MKYLRLLKPFAFEARDFIRKLIVGKQVKSVIEYSTAGGRDFGSILTYNCEETDIARILVKNGFASVRRTEGKAMSEEQIYLSELETHAIESRLGLHGDQPIQRILRQGTSRTPIFQYSRAS